MRREKRVVDRLPALEFWRRTKYSPQVVNDTFERSSVASRIVRVRRKRGAEPEFDWHPGQDLGNLSDTALFLKRVFARYPTLEGSVLLTLHDGVDSSAFDEFQFMKAPLLVYSKRIDDHFTIPIPDPLFTGDRIVEELRSSVRELDGKFPWEARSAKVFWRGRTTGPQLTAANWRMNPRIRLSILSKETNDDSILDAYVSEVVQCKDCEVKTSISELGLLRAYVPLPEMFMYRHQIDIDGNFSAWSFALKLAMNCVVFKVESPYEQWFSRELVPWRHYIPVSPTMRDLLPLARWAQAHEEVCREIAGNASTLMSTWRDEDTEEYMGETLRVLFEECTES